MQNISHAVMAQRHEAKDSRDDFPTPPWGTRALLEHVIHPVWKNYNCLEPACGRGYMADVLREYFGAVAACDVFDYGYAGVQDWLVEPAGPSDKKDWIITNPPFRLAEQFIHKALAAATVGVAMLCRSQFDEGKGRYERLFRDNPPSIEAVFVERLPMVKGRVDRKASTATSYSWFVWQKGMAYGCRKMWIPPCRKQLECEGDYQ